MVFTGSVFPIFRKTFPEFVLPVMPSSASPLWLSWQTASFFTLDPSFFCRIVYIWHDMIVGLSSPKLLVVNEHSYMRSFSDRSFWTPFRPYVLRSMFFFLNWAFLGEKCFSISKPMLKDFTGTTLTFFQSVDKQIGDLCLSFGTASVVTDTSSDRQKETLSGPIFSF